MTTPEKDEAASRAREFEAIIRSLMFVGIATTARASDFVYVTVKNTTGVSAADLHVPFTGAGSSEVLHTAVDVFTSPTRPLISVTPAYEGPIELARARMLEKGFASEDELTQIDKNVRALITEAAEFAQAGPEPDAAELWTDVYR